MSYSIDLTSSARRHIRAADQLDDSGERPHEARRDVAGYLFGVAAECAMKQIMRKSGIFPLSHEERRDDPFYAHFPDLKTMLRDQIRGRRSETLRRFAMDDSFMNEWSTDMRYAPGKDILPRLVDRWRDQAHAIVDCIEET